MHPDSAKEADAPVPRLTTTTSSKLFTLAKTMIPGGVNSPVRAFGSVGGTPLFIESAKGSTVRDVDGNTFIDYVGSWGPMILGHAPPAVVSPSGRRPGGERATGRPRRARSGWRTLSARRSPPSRRSASSRPGPRRR